MEEWHQKLHNNTTPDDVPICSAYLAFLEVRTPAYCAHQH
jgi:alpha-glucan,water dikinase